MASKSYKLSASNSRAVHRVPSISASSVRSQSKIPKPLRQSGIPEKITMASLNDKLAAYIERCKQLENRNATLLSQLVAAEENKTRAINQMTKNHNKALSESRRLVDEALKVREKLALEHEKLKKEHDKTKKEIGVLQVKISNLESQLQAASNVDLEKDKVTVALQSQLSKLTSQLEAVVSNGNKVNMERSKLKALKKQLVAENTRLKDQLYAELNRRIEAEDKLKVKTNAEENNRIIEELSQNLAVGANMENHGLIVTEAIENYNNSVQENNVEVELKSIFDSKSKKAIMLQTIRPPPGTKSSNKVQVDRSTYLPFNPKSVRGFTASKPRLLKDLTTSGSNGAFSNEIPYTRDKASNVVIFSNATSGYTLDSKLSMDSNASALSNSEYEGDDEYTNFGEESDDVNEPTSNIKSKKAQNQKNRPKPPVNPRTTVTPSSQPPRIPEVELNAYVAHVLPHVEESVIKRIIKRGNLKPTMSHFD